MKQIRTIYLLLATAFTTQVNTSFGMNMATTIAKAGIATICSGAELFLTTAPALSNVLFNPADLRAEKLKISQSNAPIVITNFVDQIATKRGLKNVKVILSDDAHGYGTNDNGNIIEIPKKQAAELEQLLAKPTLTPEEQEKLDEHTGTLHHELTHCRMRSLKYVPMYDAVIGTIGAVTISATLTHFSNKYLPSIKNNFALHNAFKLGRGALTLSLAYKLMNMNLYKKYDELKADNGIPNQKNLLVAQMKRHEKRHDIHLHWVDTIKERASFYDIISPPEGNDFPRLQLLAMKIIPKSLFNKPLVMDIVFHANKEHLSDLRRALRFKQRIKDIDHAATTDQN